MLPAAEKATQTEREGDDLIRLRVLLMKVFFLCSQGGQNQRRISLVGSDRAGKTKLRAARQPVWHHR